jgi:hypothetical protein
MATEKFNWKGLFVNEVETEESIPQSKKSPQADNVRSFPEANKISSKFPESDPAQKTAVSQSVLDSVVAMYEAGFESLNQPGYDFFEFFKAIESVGSHEPQMYKMAMTMAQTVDKKVNKELLLTKAEYYITEINKVHSQYFTQGTAKKEQILSDQKSQKELLYSEISHLEKSLIEIKEQIDKKRTQLQSVDTNMITEVSEIDQKITCNDLAKAKIQEAILTVVNGIKNNL